MLELIVHDNYEVVRLRYRVLSPEIRQLLNEKLLLPFYNIADEREICISFNYQGNNFTLTNQNIREFNNGKSISAKVMDCYITLQSVIDLKSLTAYNSAHGDDRGFIAAKKKMFLPSSFLSYHAESTAMFGDLSESYIKISIPIQKNNGNWTCLIIDVGSKSILYFDPGLCEETEVKRCMKVLERLINRIFEFKTLWKCERLIHSSILKLPVLSCNEDSGIFVMAVIEYSMLQCPLYVVEGDIYLLRQNYCLQLLSAYKLN
jgi:Ulp1 family protease